MRTLGHHPLWFVFAPAPFILSSPCSSGLQALVLFLSLCYLPVIDMVFAEPPVPHSTKASEGAGTKEFRSKYPIHS